MTTTTALKTTTPTPTTGTAKDTATFGKNFDQFLKLLVTQMKNQDPMEPMDASEFTNQLVQFAGIEQNIKSNTLLENIAGNQTAGLLREGAAYVGRSVSIKSDTLVRQDTTSPSTFTYTNDKKYTNAKITILDNKGKVVRTLDNLSGEAGIKTVTWDGKDTQSLPVPAGKYTLKAVGIVKTGNGPADQTTTNLQTTTTGMVNSAGVEGGKIMLNVGGVPVSEDKIISISNS
ncbi:MAG: flagellar hook assembly protein FlgD [Alphaproteobacteria bacterium]